LKSAIGRADAVVKTADAIYVFEFKINGGSDSQNSQTSAEAALAQIDDKGYLIPYTADSRHLVKIGVEFSKEERGIRRWLNVEK